MTFMCLEMFLLDNAMKLLFVITIYQFGCDTFVKLIFLYLLFIRWFGRIYL